MTRRAWLGAAAAAAAAQTTARKLGYGPEEKLLMVHADDAGMCHSANAATIEAMTKGSVSSASVMMPCGWAPEFAEWAQANPEKDVGLHLTLTSEWRRYRWRPVAAADRVRGLLDPQGYLWRSERETARAASAAEVEIEIRAQVERARALGVPFTHLDSHMGTLFTRPDYFEAYANLAREARVVAMIPRPTPELKAIGSPITEEMILGREASGWPLIDRLVTGVPGRTVAERQESYRRLLAALQPGVTKLIIHLAMDDAEIRAITGNWEQRWADFVFWSSAEARELLARHQIRLTTYRELARVAYPG